MSLIEIVLSEIDLDIKYQMKKVSVFGNILEIPVPLLIIISNKKDVYLLKNIPYAVRLSLPERLLCV